ncbi:membrane or secreted protein [uncultured Pontibacter sp.]|uniref:membrane or secreted protein n=1 Tax=uncultured Pontibacter sp. TaxID=453356 RepID=UPI00261039A2|nr:membrane or secreted protein [uncultured Pontibacter sp.]
MIKPLKNTAAAGLGLLFLIGCAGAAATEESDQSATTKSDGAIQATNPNQGPEQQAAKFEGAWQLQNVKDNQVVMLLQDGFFTVAMYDQQNKQFLGTTGGTYSIAGDKLTINQEFNTFDSTMVGSSSIADFKLENNQWMISNGQETENWERIQENTSSPLAGTWRITGRERDGQMNTMRPGPRKTLKVLSGTRFQWIAFNSETGQFSGTGGGTYTAEDGKYTEHIEFFSRDSSRVGISLSFNFEVKDGNWHHSGQSSKGSPVNEIWSRISND